MAVIEVGARQTYRRAGLFGSAPDSSGDMLESGKIVYSDGL